ncbi:hypothetical protein [Acanthopleuribacter pedis]|uniref:Uncharacterized protein n=1 Tax=Acanthopleuribacter pedis TaxID=442870 RepID=A0A8J7U217_9BACT|nr:hypothetical protein [Acanthopleuribacter pedis]MBO1318137.1 hypothetical protein [Acanthopleuribacter pedis]
MSTHSPSEDRPNPSRGGKMDRRTAIKASLTSAAAAGATFQPQVLGFVEPRKNLSGDGNGIFSFTPTNVTDCSGIQISGRGFGLEQANVCVFTNQPTVHTTPVFVDDQHVLARVDIGNYSGTDRLYLQRGQGGYETPTSFPNNLRPHGRFWAWRSNQTAYVAVNAVRYRQRPDLNPGELIFNGGMTNSWVSTLLSLPLNDTCCHRLPVGSFIRFHFFARNSNEGIAASGAFFNDIELDAVTLAAAVLNVLKATVASITGRTLQTTVDARQGANQVWAIVNYADFSFTAGSLDLRINTLGDSETCSSIASMSAGYDTFGSFSVQPGSLAKNSLSGSAASVSVTDSAVSCSNSFPVGQCPSIDAQFPDFLFN